MPQPIAIGPTGAITVFVLAGTYDVQISGRADAIVSFGGGGGQLLLPTADKAGLIGLYVLTDQSTTQFTDSSAAGNTVPFNGGGCPAAPTPLGAPSFGYSFTAASTQCGSFSAALNATKTYMIAVQQLSGNVPAGSSALLIGSTNSGYSGIAFSIGNSTGNRATTASWVNGIGNVDLTNTTLDGTFILTFVCDAGDHVYLSANGQTTEVWYFNQGGGCVPQTGAGGQVYLTGGAPWVPGLYGTFTTYAYLFWNTVKSKAQVTANANALEQYLKTARGVVLNMNSMQTASVALDCIGDSQTVGSGAISYCGNGTGNILTFPANQGPWTSFNRAQSGNTATGCNTSFPFDAQSNIPQTAAPRVHTIMLGTNDISGLGLTAAQTWTQIQQCALSIKKLDPFGLVGVATVLSRTGGGFDTTRDATNGLIRAGYQGIADFLIDIAESVLGGADSGGTDACFQGDHIHPTQGCQYNVLTPIFQRSIASKLGCLNFTCATSYGSGAPAGTADTAESESGNTMTFTSTLNPGVGSTVVCTGATPSGYNSPTGGWYVLSSSASSFTAYNDTTGLGAGSVHATCSVPQEKDSDGYVILNHNGNHTLEFAVGNYCRTLHAGNGNTPTLVPWGSETINTAATLAMTSNETIVACPQLVSASAAGANWVTVSK